jgi:hypothetical protein
MRVVCVGVGEDALFETPEGGSGIVGTGREWRALDTVLRFV